MLIFLFYLLYFPPNLQESEGGAIHRANFFWRCQDIPKFLAYIMTPLKVSEQS